ncbi:hypothetical protein [Leptolyngbya sp. 7M]|uniref:hypothetical protein n=1 Tax=Leptolyngbya sp. 7M TaxID=2812896 RepID=UPI001B8B022F|nr:hypothetical protein [Leptolyngbya sp. 7M]QYO65243.1 hypothetical protein JVX88_00210 [Leptolyngbya sp. 7M]
MKRFSEHGFSYIEVMIAIVMLSVGILALLAAISGAVMRSRGQEEQLMAKQIAASTLESLMSAKETADPIRNLGWLSIGNVGSNPDENSVPRGIFLVGEHDVRTEAGPDQVLGTADDTGNVIVGFRREIVITDICDPDRPSSACPTPGSNPVKIRSVRITVSYFIGTGRFTERINTILTDY